MDKAIFKKFIEKLSEKIDFGTRREHIRSNPDWDHAKSSTTEVLTSFSYQKSKALFKKIG